MAGPAVFAQPGAPWRLTLRPDLSLPPLELWGGHECTVNRVKDRWYDQTIRTGHEDRLEDLERFADLGLAALRYPVLWERISPDAPDKADWRWSDERLTEIRRLGMTPIAGLVHHGSGPRYTHLLDDGFAPGLARHAQAVAERYPWIEAYTPVNEPLTTARFSALYGHWYPHARDEGAFFAALLNEIDATRLAMKAIRSVNPQARLIQTDDLGYTFATPPLAHQAAYENERRWLCWDLLTGRLDPESPMTRRMETLGLGDRVKAILDDPCPPGVIGVNHYLSSERLLDHRQERYPRHTWGGNAREPYADVEAVRAVAPGPLGLERLLDQTWDRYGIPMAVTECHNGCTREEQMRWLMQTWQTAQRLRGRGVPVEAVTVWSLLGSIDWNSLLTKDHHHYEVGVYDIRSPATPRPTAMVELCRRLATGEGAPPAAAIGPGWWERDIRYVYEPVWLNEGSTPRRRWRASGGEARPLLITGASGTLGQAFARACEHRGLAYALTCRREMDLGSTNAIAAALDEIEPWAVINTAGWVRVDDAEADPAACLDANASGVERLAKACATRDLPLMSFSSDLVFDGTKGGAYTEADTPNPLNVYGRSKALAEAALEAAGGRGLMIRTAAFFSPHDPHNFAQAVVRELSRGRMFEAAEDAVVSPTYVPDLVQAALDLLIDGETGVRHLANAGAVSWADFARTIAQAVGLDSARVVGRPGASFGWAARRPADVSLSTVRGEVMPTLDSAVARYADAIRPTLKIAPLQSAAEPKPRGDLSEEARSFAGKTTPAGRTRRAQPIRI